MKRKKTYYIKHPEMGRFCGEFMGCAWWEISEPIQDPVSYLNEKQAGEALAILKGANFNAHKDCFIMEG